MDISASNWNEDDNANSTAAPDGAPEGMAPSGVNNVLRAHQGAIKRFYSWTIPKTTGGTGSDFTLAYSMAPGAYVDGMNFMVEFHLVNNANPTLNVNPLGAIPIRHFFNGVWYGLPPAWAAPNSLYRLVYHGSSGTFRVLDVQSRTGEVVPYAGATAPVGTLLCFGQAISRTDYAALFAAISTTHGAGDGSTTFNLPDLRGRVVAGKDDMGGSNAARLNSIASTTLGAAGGGQTNTASTTVSGSTAGALSVTAAGNVFDAPNTNTTSNPGVGQDHAGPTHLHANVQVSGSTSGALTVSASGTSGAFSIIQPTMILNYLIRI